MRPTSTTSTAAPTEQPAPQTVSIVIPVFNRLDLTVACLRALELGSDAGGLGAAGPEMAGCDVVMVDNGSEDGTAARVAADFPSVRIVRNQRNQGFARGCNQGVAAAKGDIVVLLNNDTEVTPGWLPPLLAALEDPGVAAAAPKLLFPDGTLQHAGLLLVDDRRRGVPFNGFHPWSRQPADLPAANVRREVRTATGAVLALRRAAFEAVGGFDEGYWNGCEDVDLCLSLAAAGWRIVYEPTSVVVHHESASGPQRWTRINENLRRLAQRWSGRAVADLVLLPDGTTLPMAGTDLAADVDAGSPAPAQASPVLRIEGAAFGLHSLAQVNREFATRLTGAGAARVTVHSGELPELTALEDSRLAPVIRATASGAHRPSVVLRQAWPPNFEPPAADSPAASAPLVVVQPWEYGGLPDAWVAPLRDIADEIWCYTSWLRDCYVASGIPADKVRVVPIGVDSERFCPDGPALGLQTAKRRRLLFVGGAVYRKGIDLVVKAYRQTFGPEDDVCLVIKTYGGATFYRGQSFDGQLRELAADPTGAEIELVEAELDQDDMAALYRACHVLVHPYRGEGFGMPIAEAMATGLAVIVTGDGAAMDFCDGECAFLVPSRRVAVDPRNGTLPPSTTGYWLAEPDLAVLGLLLRRAVNDPTACTALGRAARDRVRRQLDWDDVIELVAGRLRVLAGTTPVRIDPDAPFQREVEPLGLDGVRRCTVLAPAGPQWSGWQARIAQLVAAIAEDAPITVVVHVDVHVAGQSGAGAGAGADAAHEAVVAELVEVLEGAAVDGRGPDVLAVVDRNDAWSAARLYRSVDAVLVGGDPRLHRRAVATQRTAIVDADDPALAELLRSVAQDGGVPASAAPEGVTTARAA